MTRADIIIESVCRERGVSEAEVKSSSRVRHIYLCRQECARRLREEGYSFPAIGRFLNRNHTTIMHMLKSETSHGAPVATGRKVEENKNANETKQNFINHLAF